MPLNISWRRHLPVVVNSIARFGLEADLYCSLNERPQWAESVARPRMSVFGSTIRALTSLATRPSRSDRALTAATSCNARVSHFYRASGVAPLNSFDKVSGKALPSANLPQRPPGVATALPDRSHPPCNVCASAITAPSRQLPSKASSKCES